MDRTLRLSIDPPLVARFASLRVGAFTAARLDTAAAGFTAEQLQRLWRTTSASLARHGITLENFDSFASVRGWRDAFASCSTALSLYPYSVEALLRRVLVDGRVITPVRLVTLCCALSVRHLAPLAGCDLDALPTRMIRIRHARPATDWFVPMGARPVDVPLRKDVVVYAAGDTILSWSFSHLESRQTCLTAGTARAVFFSNALVAEQARGAADALDDLRRLLADRGARVSAPVFVDANNPEAELSCEPPVVGSTAGTTRHDGSSAG